MGDLSFGALEMTQQGANTLIRHDGDLLGVVQNVNADQLTESDFQHIAI